MKVPILEAPRVESRPVATPFSNVNLSGGQEAASQGLEHLGAGIEQMDAGIRKARERANAVAVNDQMTALQKESVAVTEGDSQKPLPGLEQGIDLTRPIAPRGILNSRGRAALQATSDGLNYLDDYSKKLEDGLTNDEQKKLFKEHATKYLLTVKSRAEAHASQEVQAAEVESLAGRKSSTLKDVQGVYDDGEKVGELAGDVESYIRAMARDPKGADAAVAEWRGQVGETVLGQMLAKKKWAAAREQLEAVRGYLGADRARAFEKLIAGTEVDEKAEQGSEILARQFRMKDGRIDVDKALEKVDGLEDVQLKEEMRKRIKERVQVADHLWETETKDISRKAFASYNTGGWRGIPRVLKDELNDRNPELYARLQKDAEFRWRLSRGDAEARRQQELNDKLAMKKYLTLTQEERAQEDVDLFLVGSGVSELGAQSIKAQQTKDKAAVRAGESEGEKAFVGLVMANGQGLAKRKSDQEALRAEAVTAYQQMKDKLKRPPSLSEAQDEATSLVKKAATKPGLIYGYNEEYEFQRRARERQEAAKLAGGATSKPETADKVEVINDKGKRGLVPTAKVGTWLSAHPGWRKR